jgi:tetratricopeptide (TPR) repeat protein
MLAAMYASDVLAAEPQKGAIGLSKNVAPLVKAASEALTNKQFDVALKKLQDAEAVDKKTPYDQFQIEEFRALAYIQQGNNFEDALAIYEKHLNTPDLLEPRLADTRLKVMTQIAFRIKAYDKAADFGKQWLATHPDDTVILDLVARTYYIAKDYKNTLDMTNKAIGVAEAAGNPPDEIWLQLVFSCASHLEDTKTLLDAYQKLVRYYPKKENWSKVLDAELTIEKNDLAILNVLRLMVETDVLDKPDLYFEYSQRAVEAGLPGEALKVLETGQEKKVIGADAGKTRYQQVIADVRQKARTDRAQLPELEKEQQQSKSQTGQASAGLGLAYFGYQMYDKAIEALESGIAKGGLRNIDSYRMALGISYLRSGQKEKARATFQTIPADSPVTRVAAFWISRTYN